MVPQGSHQMETDMIIRSTLRAGLAAATLLAFALPASAAEITTVDTGHHGTIISRMVHVFDFAAGKLKIAKADTNMQNDAAPMSYGPRALPGTSAQIGRGVGR